MNLCKCKSSYLLVRLRKWGGGKKKKDLYIAAIALIPHFGVQKNVSVSPLVWFLSCFSFFGFHISIFVSSPDFLAPFGQLTAHIFTSCVCVRQSSAQCSLPQKQVTHFYDTRCHKAVKRFFHLHIISKRGKTESVRVQSVKIKLHNFNRVKVKHGNKIIQPSGSPAQRV